MARDVVKPEQIVTIYKSQTFPTSAYGLAYNLKPELAAKIKEAFFTFPFEGSALLAEFKNSSPPQEKFIPITFQKHWEVVRQVDKALGVAYTCK
jgi:phosphonate transport system substrate-binding protein